MKIFFALVFLLLTGAASFGQEPKPKSETQDKVIEVTTPSLEEILASHPLPVPELALQRALKIAEAYRKKRGAKLSDLHLIEAKFTFLGDEKGPLPSWHFYWRRKGSTNFLGYHEDFYVFMNGRVWNPPTM